MNSPEERWWTVRTGEYVLGTLRGEDLILFERILSHDTEVQSEVALWEQRLAALNEQTAPVQPADHNWPIILERVRSNNRAEINVTEQAGTFSTTTASAPEQSSAPHVNLPQKNQPTHAEKSRVWPWMAGLATAASVLLGVLLLQQISSTNPPQLNVDGVAVVLSDEDGKPYFLVETDYDNQRVRVTTLSPPSLDESQQFQLWQALPDRSSVRPVALLPTQPGETKTYQVDLLIVDSDLFGVSIEPQDAETASGPTGPVVAHGDFQSVLKSD